MLKNNADQIAKELEAYSAQLVRKLEHMVAGFAGDVALQAAINTPKATEAYVQSHQTLYEQRLRQFGIEVAPGFHQGSWQYSEGELTFDPTIRSTAMVENQVEGEALANYKLGDKFYIGSNSPNMPYLEQRDNISGKVTEAGALAAYASNLKLHFDRG